MGAPPVREVPPAQELPQVQEEALLPEDPQQLVEQHPLGVQPLLGDLPPQVALRLLGVQPLLVVPHLLVDLPQQGDLPQQEPQQLPLQLERPPPICREEDKLWHESSLSWKLLYHHNSSYYIPINQYNFSKSNI